MILSKKSYIPEFDGLRALAAIAVIFGHSAAAGSWMKYTKCPVIAVRFFFVLSGFLITGILLGMKDRVEAGHSRRGAELRTFYLRRALRIFPPYFAFLLFFLAIGDAFVTHTFPWHALYLSNFYAAFVAKLQSPVAHLWTLAVEEQFYLLWPFALMLLPRRSLKPFLISAIIAAVAFRTAMAFGGADREARGMLPISCLDALGLGSLVAVWAAPQTFSAAGLKAVSRLGWSVGLPGMLLTIVLAHPRVGWLPLFATLGHLCIALWSAAVLLAFLKPEPGWGSRVLRSAPMVGLGQISYGIYLYHYPQVHFFEQLARTVPAVGAVPRFWWVLLGSIAVASVSWFALERPLLRLKRHFRYGTPDPGTPTVPPSLQPGGLTDSSRG